jgi:hypothetical protein
MAFDEEQIQTPQTQSSRAMSEDPSYHAIKVFNMIEDSLWEQFDLLGNAVSIDHVVHIAKEVRVLLLRGDKVWNEIKKAVEIQASGLKIRATAFSYKGEFSAYAAEILKYLKIASNAGFLAFNGSPEEQELAQNYLELPSNERMGWLMRNVEGKILDATEKWGELAAEINFTMPINIKDTRDPFL